MMKRIKAKLIGKGFRHDPFRVNLPTYSMDCERDKDGNPIWINEVEAFVKDSVDYQKKTCYVLVPDDEAELVNGKMKLKEKTIREKYGKWKKFKAKNVEAG